MSDDLEPSRQLRAHLRAEIRLLNLQFRSMSPWAAGRALVEAELEALCDRLVDVEQSLHKRAKYRESLEPPGVEAKRASGGK